MTKIHSYKTVLYEYRIVFLLIKVPVVNVVVVVRGNTIIVGLLVIYYTYNEHNDV